MLNIKIVEMVKNAVEIKKRIKYRIKYSDIKKIGGEN